MIDNVYLDASATTPLLPEVKQTIVDNLGLYGNASSLYSLGQEAHMAVEQARADIAEILRCNPNCIIFNSGGSESNASIITEVFYHLRSRGNHIITTKIEHKSVLRTCEFLEAYCGAEVTYLDVDSSGIINLDQLRDSITDQTILISVMHTNNEIGSVQPVGDISAIARERGILFHSDCVQAFMHRDIDYQLFDAMSVSAHKFGGPKGVGFLYLKEGLLLPSYIHGTQELGRRGGTTNNLGILAMAKAVEVNAQNMAQWNEKTKRLAYYLRGRILEEIPGTRLNGPEFSRAYNNVNISFAGCRGEELEILLDIARIQCSTGSACNSTSKMPSAVLKAIGLTDDDANASLRFSLSHENTKEEMDYVVERLKELVKRIRGE